MAAASAAAIEHRELRPVRRDERRQAFALLWRAARPDRRQLILASALLLAAGGLEALGPIFGKLFMRRVPAAAPSRRVASRATNAAS